MSDSLTTWRRRCLAAEDRAETSEQRAAKLAASVKRLTTQSKRLRSDLAAMHGALEGLVEFADASRRILVRLAHTHLGPDAPDDEADQLVSRWLDDDGRREEKTRPVAIQIHLTHDELLRRLGFDPFGESE